MRDRVLSGLSRGVLEARATVVVALLVHLLDLLLRTVELLLVKVDALGAVRSDECDAVSTRQISELDATFPETHFRLVTGDSLLKLLLHVAVLHVLDGHRRPEHNFLLCGRHPRTLARYGDDDLFVG